MQRSFEVIGGNNEPERTTGFTAVTSSMDVARPDLAKKKKKRRLIIIGGSALALVVIGVAVSRLKPGRAAAQT